MSMFFYRLSTAIVLVGLCGASALAQPAIKSASIRAIAPRVGIIALKPVTVPFRLKSIIATAKPASL